MQLATRLQKAGMLLAVLKRNAGMLLDLSCLLQLQNGHPYPVISLISFFCVYVCVGCLVFLTQRTTTTTA